MKLIVPFWGGVPYLRYFHWTRGPTNLHWVMGDGASFHKRTGWWNSPAANDTRRKKKREGTRLENILSMHAGEELKNGQWCTLANRNVEVVTTQYYMDIIWPSSEFIRSKLTDSTMIADWGRRRVFHRLLHIQSGTWFLNSSNCRCT